MSCLLPQFKCQPDSFSIQFRNLQHHSTNHIQLSAKNGEPFCFRAQYALPSASPSTSTAVLNLEKLRLPSLESHSDSIAANRPWTYIGGIGPPKEPLFGTSLATETVIINDEAVIAAAAAEAVALARAAVKVAKDAAEIAKNYCSVNTETKIPIASTADSFSSMWSLLTGKERADIIGVSFSAETGLREECSTQYPTEESECFGPTHEELALLQKQLSESIVVRSKRQTQRKAKRARAAEKADANFVFMKSGSACKKKHVPVQEVDQSDPLRFFRGASTSSRLLSATEEVELSEGIQDLLKLERIEEELKERFGGKPSFAQWAAAARVDQMTLRKRLNYGVLCKDKMIKSNIRLVISIAKNYQGAGMNLQDLVQEGCRGLARGAEKFDASKGFKFSTYAHWWIRQAVRRSLSDQSRTIRLPFHMVDATYRVKEARKQLYSENGRHPDDKEVAEATGLSMKRLSAVLLTPKAPRSLDQKMGFNMDLKLSEVTADPEAETAEDLLMKEFMKKDLERVLESLSPRENQVIRWRFGMEDGRMKTLQEIGELMGVSRERIRQIELSAFRKLKNKNRTKQLRQYLVS
ncbi:RNA polymerase sigma factor sigB isoform X1 [Populus alba]|uniref:RNA polymerase sigma factor n=2 Tax=Populus TaxID=3689 RepID=A0A4U5PS24_POPAL|nr:RNA polymerase sigma factor sigB-like isoform X1 [Populus alba]KAJ6951884.1 RNA polymerase sigma factor sigB-like isoform X1 [Populus alba x Populus x berolinensis]TKR98434.1 RNA polymerase sigma factor sigB-like [Populus alba]